MLAIISFDFLENFPWNHFEHFHFDTKNLSSKFSIELSVSQLLVSWTRPPQDVDVLVPILVLRRLELNCKIQSILNWKLDYGFVTILIRSICQWNKFSTAEFFFLMLKINFYLQFWLVNKKRVPNRYVSRHFYPFISEFLKIQCKMPKSVQKIYVKENIFLRLSLWHLFHLMKALSSWKHNSSLF